MLEAAESDHIDGVLQDVADPFAINREEHISECLGATGDCHRNAIDRQRIAGCRGCGQPNHPTGCDVEGLALFGDLALAEFRDCKIGSL